MFDRCVFIGQIISGRGITTSRIRKNGRELKNGLGVDLHEGSLNVILSHPLRLVDEHAIQFDNFGLLWPALLGGISVWVYRWQQAPLHIVELLSTIHLRSALNLRDGDKIRLEIRRMDIDRVPCAERLVWHIFWSGRRRWFYTSNSYCSLTTKWCREFGATQEGTKGSIWNIGTVVMTRLLKRTPGVNALLSLAKRFLGTS